MHTVISYVSNVYISNGNYFFFSLMVLSYWGPFCKSTNKQGGQFLKKLWCCVGGDVKHKILDLSTELIR